MKKIANFRAFPTILTGMIVGISFIILTDLWLPVTIAAIAGVIAVASFAVLCVKRRGIAKSALAFCVCFVVGVGAGLLAAFYAESSIEKKEIFADNVTITAKIEVGNSTDLSGKADSYRVILTDIVVDGEEVDGKAEFTSMQLESGDYKEGDVIRFVGSIKTLSSDITTPYKATSLADGVIYSITCEDDENVGEIEIVWQSLDFFDKIKKAVAAKLSANVPDGTARFMYAMLFGDSSVVEYSVRGDFSDTGTAHLLAVSGLHVGMIAGALTFLLKKLRLNAVARSIVVTAFLIFFCALCGFSPSTVRATLMVVICMAAGLFGLRYDALSGMSFAAIILLFVSPYNLYSLGFLMSFIAVYGLILFAKPIKAALVRIHCPSWLASALSATVSANITLLPIMIYVFGDVSLIFVLANCIIVPLTGVFFPIYALALPFSFIPYFGGLMTAAAIPFTGMTYLIKFFAGIDFPTVYFNFTWATIVLWLVAATAVSTLCLIPSMAKKIIASVLVISFVAAVAIQNAGMLSAENKVTCFVCGEGAGALIESEDEGDFIVFAGEIDEVALEAAAEAMKDSRLRKVDFVVKYEFTQQEAELYDEYAETFGAETVYTLYTPSVNANTSSLIMLSARASVVCTAMYTAVFLGGTDLFLSGGERGIQYADSYDVVAAPVLSEKPQGAQYLLSDRAYYAEEQDCLPSSFTFWTEDGKIIKINKWRFA